MFFLWKNVKKMCLDDIIHDVIYLMKQEKLSDMNKIRVTLRA